MFVCPVWENWSSWGSCSATCGTGQKTATRTCNTFGIPVLVCDGENTRSEFCHEEDCLRKFEEFFTDNCCNSAKKATLSKLALNTNVKMAFRSK